MSCWGGGTAVSDAKPTFAESDDKPTFAESDYKPTFAVSDDKATFLRGNWVFKIACFQREREKKSQSHSTMLLASAGAV